MTPEVARHWAAERAREESRLIEHANDFERVMYEGRLAQQYYEYLMKKPENGR